MLTIRSYSLVFTLLAGDQFSCRPIVCGYIISFLRFLLISLSLSASLLQICLLLVWYSHSIYSAVAHTRYYLYLSIIHPSFNQPSLNFAATKMKRLHYGMLNKISAFHMVWALAIIIYTYIPTKLVEP